MNSSISPFRGWIVALAAFVAIETTLFAVAPTNPIDRTNFLQYSFARPEPAQRLFVFHKLRAFADAQPTIVQSGDSSGFYGIDPRVVMKHLPVGISYLNMSCCANLGFNGYYNVLDFMARRNPSVRTMVLHITPYTMPRPEMWAKDGANIWGAPGLEVFGDAVSHEFIGPWRFLHVASLAYRSLVTNTVFYLGPMIDRFRVAPSLEAGRSLPEPSLDILRTTRSDDPYFEFLSLYRDTRGWTPERDVRGGVYAVECDIQTSAFFDLRSLSSRTYLEEVFQQFAALARSHRATLVIVFQPVACLAGGANAEARAIVDRFKRNNPDVEIPFPLIETWPADMFSVPAHVRREHTDLIGERLGKAMAEIVARHAKN